MDANSSLSSSRSSLSTAEVDKSLIKDFKSVQETGCEEVLLSDYEMEETDRKSNDVSDQELLERVEYGEMSPTGHVSRLEYSKVLHPPLAKEEEGNENVDG